MCMVKKTPKASLLVIYYAKLTEIFWISSSHLYHAYAWLKLFSLQKSFNKNLSQKDLQLIASSVVLAALSVSPYDCSYGASHLELENEKERRLRVANLIGFNVEPKPESREMVSKFSVVIDFMKLLNMIFLSLTIINNSLQLSRSSLLSELVRFIIFFAHISFSSKTSEEKMWIISIISFVYLVILPLSFPLPHWLEFYLIYVWGCWISLCYLLL